ncbi:MAG TPA: ATP-grasp domain-containing protein [Planctomycetota bacterium]|jgi:carbamoyl-phosphate synthase large subunit
MGTWTERDTAASSVTGPAKAPHAQAGTVLVTGVGGIVGQGILKCLANTPHRVVGADASETAVGLYAASKGYLVPAAKDPAYIDRLLEICAAERVRYLFPGLDMELPIFARAADRFRGAGVVPIVSSAAVVDLADDKLETVRFLESHGLPALRTWDLAEWFPPDLCFPLVLKPRKGGSRAQGVYTVTNEEELRYRVDRIDRSNYVIQEHVAGDEFTCGTINFDGRCHGVIVMRRTLRDGDTHKAFVVREPEIESCVREAAERLKPFGPCNFQLRLRSGRPCIFDINPRCSGTSYCRALAGFNEPRMTLDRLERGADPAFEIRPISVFRYWQEIVVENGRLDETRRAGMTRNEGRRL